MKANSAVELTVVHALNPPPTAIRWLVTSVFWLGSAGVVVLMLLVQIMMVPRYRRLRFSLGFWSFTFPLAATVSLTEKWLELLEPTGWRVITGVLAVAFTALIIVIAAFSLRPAVRLLKVK